MLSGEAPQGAERKQEQIEDHRLRIRIIKIVLSKYRENVTDYGEGKLLPIVFAFICHLSSKVYY